VGREGVTVDMAMEKAEGKVAPIPKQTFLATLSDPQVNLLSIHKRWSFRRSSGITSLARPVSLEEKGSLQPQPEEGEFLPRVLNGTQERSSQQVSVAAEGLRSHDGLGPTLQSLQTGFSGSLCEGLGRALGEEVRVQVIISMGWGLG
jgi:hypothetical protein